MKKLLLISLLLFVLNSMKAQPTENINMLINRLVYTSNHHDAAGFAACFTANADFTNVLGMQAHGRADIEKFHARLFSSKQMPGAPSFYHAVLHIQSKTIRFIKPDVAAVDIIWDQSGAVGPDGKPWPPRKGLINTIAVENHGQWLFVVFHNMDIGEFKPDK